ncbi:MAG: HlyD family secretion protein [Geminicoccaceae bacterium]|nr:HlyD family secretion protein [Geminicoccaceae bacterium]
MTRPGAKKRIGVLLCVSAVVFGAVAWWWAGSLGEMSTDNAYVHGDIVALAPRVGGYVTSVEVSDNQIVQVGDILFRIDDRDYRARLAQAVANVEAAQAKLENVDADTVLQQATIRQAKAELQAAVANLDLARKENDRRRKLGQTNTISQSGVDESDAERLRAEAGLAAATAALDAQQQRVKVLTSQRDAAVAAKAQAEAARELAALDLEDTVVRAPVGGVIGNRQVRTGRLVTPGAPLVDIVPVDNVWLVANFKETQIGNIHAGQHVRVAIDGFPDQAFTGVVDSLAPGSGSAFSMLPADNATGNFVRVVQRVPVKIRIVENPVPGRIVPGLSARVTVESGEAL